MRQPHQLGQETHSMLRTLLPVAGAQQGQNN
jgi:hypothetical protein